MEIIRIPTSYISQLEYLPDKDVAYITMTLFKLCNGENILVEKSMRGGLLISIYREALQMENKTRAKKGKKSLKIDLATLTADTDGRHGEPTHGATKSSQVKSNQEKIISKEITTIVESHGLEDINKMQEYIKEQVVNLGFLYKSGKQERNRIRNILTGKEINFTAKKYNMSIYEFVGNIIILSSKLEFWSGKVTNAETFYKYYDKILNESLRIKRIKESNIMDYGTDFGKVY